MVIILCWTMLTIVLLLTLIYRFVEVRLQNYVIFYKHVRVPLCVCVHASVHACVCVFDLESSSRYLVRLCLAHVVSLQSSHFVCEFLLCVAFILFMNNYHEFCLF